MIKSKKYYLAKTKGTANTFIGGVSATVNTAALVASKLGISAGRISNFSIVGSDIKFTVTGGSYSMPIACWNSNTDITYYHDIDGLVTNFTGNNNFLNATNLQEVKFKNLLIIRQSAFSGTKLSGTGNDFSSVTTLWGGAFYRMASSAGTVIDLPSLTTFSGNNTFEGHLTLSNNVTFNVPVALKTISSGNPHSELTTTLLRAVIINYIGFVEDATYNTDLGGYGGIYANKGLFAQFFGFGSGALVNYQSNVSGDTRFKMLVPYDLGFAKYQNNTTITHYYDLDGLVTNFAGNNNFLNATNLQEVKFKNLLIVRQAAFSGTKLSGTGNDFSSVHTVFGNAFSNLSSSSGTVINLPSLTTFAGTNTFAGHSTLSNNVTFNVPIALKTISSGNPHSELTISTLKAVIINYIGFVDTNDWNTSIGGYGGVYANKGLFAQSYGVGSGAMVNFANDSGDLKVRWLINYVPIIYNGNSIITHFRDLEGKVVNVPYNSTFQSTANITDIELRGCLNLGSTVGNNNIFNNIKIGCVITVPIALQTADAGSPDGDLVYAATSRSATIIYI